MFGDRNTGRILGACCGKNKREKKDFFLVKLMWNMYVFWYCFIMILINIIIKSIFLYYKVRWHKNNEIKKQN